MSRSSSSSTTSTATSDHRVAGDNGAVGVSAGGDVMLDLTTDEAWELADVVVSRISDLATETVGLAGKSQATLAAALETTQQNNKTEAGQLSQQLVQVGIPAALIAVAIISFSGQGK